MSDSESEKPIVGVLFSSRGNWHSREVGGSPSLPKNNSFTSRYHMTTMSVARHMDGNSRSFVTPGANSKHEGMQCVAMTSRSWSGFSESTSRVTSS